MRSDQFDGLAAFLSVADRGGFSAAAAELGVTRSAVSLTIRTLERRLGVPLFTRTTRSVGLTEAGARLYEQCRPLVDELLTSLDGVREMGREPSGTLRLNVPRVAIPVVIEPILAEFAVAYPKIGIEVFAEDGFADLARGGFDAGVRLGEQVEKDMTAMRLTPPFRWVAVASPGYLAKRGQPMRPGDLRDHNCINYRFTTGGDLYRWEFVEHGRIVAMPVRGQIIVNDTATKLRAAADGLGIAYDIEPLCAPYLTDGRLKAVLADYCLESPGFFLYYPNRAQVMLKLRAFIDFARKRLKDGLWKAR